MTPSTSTGSPRSLLRLAGLLAAFAALALSAGCSRPADPAPADTAAPALVVKLAPINRTNAAVPIRATGLLARRDEAGLSFKVDGVVEAVLVRAGDTVKAGQELARLRLDEIEARAAAARSALDKARRDEERIGRLQAKAVSTLENLQDARTAVELAEAQMKIAGFNRRFAVITAPADGRILQRNVEPDEYVAPGRIVLGFASDSSGWLARAGLSSRDVARLSVGDRAEVAGAVGHLSQISAAADPATRTIAVEIALDSSPADARSGSVAPVVMHPPAGPSRPVVPASALIEATGSTAHLFVVDAGSTRARRLTVEIEALHGDLAYLRTSLPSGTQLVIQGGEYLRDGSLIQPAP